MLSYLKTSDLSGFKAATDEQAAAWKDVPTSDSGIVYLIYGGENANIKYSYYYDGELLST